MAAATGLVRLMAVGEIHPEGFAENINLIVEDVPPAVNREQYMKMSEHALAEISIDGNVQSEVAHLGDREYVILSYIMPAPSAHGGVIDVAGIAFTTIEGNRAYIMTFTAPSSAAAYLSDFARSAMATFRVKE